MPSRELAPVVQAFLAAHVRTVEHLHVLMTIINGGDRWWDAHALCRELHTSIGVSRRALDWFAQHNLLDIRITDDVRYQFRPGTEELREAALAAADAFHTNPIAVLHQVTGATRRGMRDFADAFRIRRDDDDR